MYKKSAYFTCVIFLTSFFGCGALNETTELTKQANEGVAQSNQLQTQMLELQFKMLDYMKSTDALMREMGEMTKQMQLQTEQMASDTNDNMAQANELMKKTLEYMRMQAVGASMAGLVAPENTEFLNPPTKMEPYADTLCKEATPLELTQLSYALEQDFLFSDASKGQKTIFVYAFSLIGAFSSTEKMNQIITDQIINHGQYEEMTYMLLYGRYEAIRDLFFFPVARDAEIYNVATLTEAVTQYVKMKYLTTLPFFSLIRLKVPALFINRTIDKNEVIQIGAAGKAKFTANLSSTDLAKPEVQALLQQLVY